MKVFEGHRVPIKAWVDGVEFEDAARAQVMNLTALPFIHKHVALMPDVHMGFGSTVGSVIATDGAIIPAAVGVDIGCLDRDTEILTPLGWVKIVDWTPGSPILQFDPDGETAEFSEPLAFIKKPTATFYHLKHGKGLDQMVCPNHKVLFYEGYGRDTRPYSIHIAKSFVRHHRGLRKGFAGGFAATYQGYQGGVDISPEIARVHVMVSADGSLRERGVCEVHVSKSRKVERGKEAPHRGRHRFPHL